MLSGRRFNSYYLFQGESKILAGTTVLADAAGTAQARKLRDEIFALWNNKSSSANNASNSSSGEVKQRTALAGSTLGIERKLIAANELQLSAPGAETVTATKANAVCAQGRLARNAALVAAGAALVGALAFLISRKSRR